MPVEASPERWAAGWAARLDARPDAVFVRGGGRHADAIAARLPGALVVSWTDAPDRELFEPLRVRTATPAFVETLAHRTMSLALEVFRASPDCSADGPPVERFDALLGGARRRAEVEQGTLSTLAPLWLENLAENADAIATLPSVSALRGRFRGRPVFVVGAGPSLDPALPLIRRAAGRAAIIAATSAARPLARAGIVPDALVVIEGRDCTGHFDGIDRSLLARTALIADSTTSPAHLSLPFAARYLFHGGLAAWLEPWGGPGSVVPTGGNVGTASTVLAWLAGGSPVVLAGLDFALHGERYYASGSGSVRARGIPAGASDVEGWDGAPVVATPELCCFREQTEAVVEAIARRDRTTRFLSVAAHGARVRGVRLATSEQVAQLVMRCPPGDPGLAGASERPLATAGSAGRSAEIRDAIGARLAALLRDDRGPALSLATLRPADSLPMIVAGPPIIAAAREGRRGTEDLVRRLRPALARFAATGDAVLDAIARRAAS